MNDDTRNDAQQTGPEVQARMGRTDREYRELWLSVAAQLGKSNRAPADVLAATDYVVPALEIVDARVQDPRKIFDTVSDNGAAAGLTWLRRAAGFRLIALGERLAGGRDGRVGNPLAPLRPAGNGAH